jgi:lambda family phage portal protein
MARGKGKVIQMPAQARPMGRQWAAAKLTGLTSDWPIYQRPVDQDIRQGLAAIRARSRELCQTSDHARGVLRIVRNNLVGAPGFVLQSRAATPRGKPDQRLRKAIEDQWRAWGKRGVCEVTGRFSWRELQRHVAETAAQDGEAFVRMLLGWDNDFGLALQVIDPEAVDILYNDDSKRIRMGVELDEWRRPVAYYLLGEPPINGGGYRYGTERYRVPAAEMMHIYRQEHAWQTRGVPWLATPAGRLHMIQGTEDAEVTASRASAAKFAAYEAHEWAPPPEPTNAGLVDAAGNPISMDPGAFAQDIAPGTMEVVPYGYSLNMLDPQHPNAAMPDFLKWGLRSVATGMGVSYNTLGNDAEGVNYTSLRFFLGVERDNWMELQDWFESEFCEPIRQAWTDEQLFEGRLPVRPNGEAEAHRVHWQARRWEGPDPAKQANADQTELAIGTTSLTEICTRKGRDFDDLLAERMGEIAAINTAAVAAGLTLEQVALFLGGLPKPVQAEAKPKPEADPNDDDQPETDEDAAEAEDQTE